MTIAIVKIIYTKNLGKSVLITIKHNNIISINNYLSFIKLYFFYYKNDVKLYYTFKISKLTSFTKLFLVII